MHKKVKKKSKYTVYRKKFAIIFIERVKNGVSRSVYTV